MSEQTTYTAKRPIIGIAVLLFICLGIIVAVNLSNWDSWDKKSTTIAVGIFIPPLFLYLLALRRKKIVLSDEGIEYYSTVKTIDRGLESTSHYRNLRWDEIEYLSATQQYNIFILTCHLTDGRIVKLRPSDIDPKAASDIFERHHAYTK